MTKPATPSKKPDHVSVVAELAEKLGETRGHLKALDDRVKHNCSRNEKNFSDVKTDIRCINKNILDLIESNGKVVTSLKVRNGVKLAIIVIGVLVGAAAFIGGSFFRWERIDGFFERTSASERAEMVKQVVETAKDLSK